MKRAYSVSSYAKLYEKYCKENLPSEADGIFKRLMNITGNLCAGTCRISERT